MTGVWLPVRVLLHYAELLSRESMEYCLLRNIPLIGAMAGGGIGGLLGGLAGMTQYVISTPGFISIPAYINPDGTSSNLIWAMAVMILAVAVAFGVTYVLGRRMEKQS